MLSLPQRSSLVQQTLAILRRSLVEGRWSDWLPPERELAALLKISRPTLRQALLQLQREELLSAEHGRGYRLLKAPDVKSDQGSPLVHLLSPDPVYTLRHQTVLWIEELHDRVRAAGGDLLLHHGERFARERPDTALAQLVARHPHGCWVLAHSTEGIQRWFATRRIPCIVAGSPHPGTHLPFVTLDTAAVARHAVGVLLRHGHRRIAWFGPRTSRAGDLIAEETFTSSIAALAMKGVSGRVVHSGGAQRPAICRTVDRLMQGEWKPTALILASAETYVTVATHLPRLGFCVPRDISLIARERDSMLAHLVPEPCTYAYSASRFGRRLSEMIDEIRTGVLAPGSEGKGTLILCDYVAGESVAIAAKP